MTKSFASVVLEDQEGNSVALLDHCKQYLLLYFYPKDDTPGCSLQAKDFSENIDFFEQHGIKVFGVSPDSVASHAKFCQKQNLKITLLSDPEKRLIHAFSVWGVKKNYGKEYEGLIRSSFLLDITGNIIHEWRNVRAKGHVQKLIKELPALL